MDKQGRGLSNTVWTQLDRKAGAIIELTIRQLRNRMSTWAVLGVGVLLISLLLAFYIDAIRTDFESIDNDGDSEDWDNDGYPLGQELMYGTSDYDNAEFPGSPEYVYLGDIDFNDQPRNHYGNHTWVYAWGYFTPTWIDVNATSHSPWLESIDWSLGDYICEEEGLSSDPFDNYNWYNSIDRNYCLFENGTYIMFGTYFSGEGEFFVEPDYNTEWGFMTESFFVEKHPKSMYIDEDDIDWDGNSGSQGFDDDGDCLKEQYVTEDNFQSDSNQNGIYCDVQWTFDSDGNLVRIQADNGVDEDPDDSKHVGESSHRTFIIGTGKIAFIMILGLFLPLFLALGLVRDESENGTLHYLLSKPIHRGEFILYRLLGYLAIVASYTVILISIVSIITSIIGPGDSIIRLSDFPIWMGIALSTILVLSAYGAIFNTVGLLMPKYGVYLCIIYGIWEFLMGLFTITIPTATIPMLSISHWAIQIIDAVVLIFWSDTSIIQQKADAFGLETGISFFWHPPVHTLDTGNPFVALLISVVLILLATIGMVALGQLVFRNKEIM